MDYVKVIVLCHTHLWQAALFIFSYSSKI